jgi:hypothetical protein
VTSEQYAWMAAIVDLKGMLLKKNNKDRAKNTAQMVLVVESKHLAIIRRLAELTGTAPEAKRVQEIKDDWMRRGCIEHCPQAHIHHHEKWQMPATQRWSITGAAAGVVLHNLRPYLVDDMKPYDEFVTKVLEQATLTGRGSGATRTALARLINLGWELPPQLAEELSDLIELTGAGV